MAVAEVFKDSAGFLAFWDASDEHHAAALHLQRELVRKRRRFVTTDYIVDETATLLLVRHSHGAAADFMESVERSDALRIEWVGSERFIVSAPCRQGMVLYRLRQLHVHARIKGEGCVHDRSSLQTGRFYSLAEALRFTTRSSLIRWSPF